MLIFRTPHNDIFHLFEVFFFLIFQKDCRIEKLGINMHPQILKRHSYYIFKTCFNSTWHMFYLSSELQIKSAILYDLKTLYKWNQWIANQNNVPNIFLFCLFELRKFIEGLCRDFRYYYGSIAKMPNYQNLRPRENENKCSRKSVLLEWFFKEN